MEEEAGITQYGCGSADSPFLGSDPTPTILLITVRAGPLGSAQGPGFSLYRPGAAKTSLVVGV